MSKMQKLALEVTKREGKKQQLSKAQVDEVLACVSDIMAEADEVEAIEYWGAIVKNGMRRQKRKKSKRAA